MGGLSREKGFRWALLCRRALEARGLTVHARQPGETGDDLTIVGLPWLSVECKNAKKMKVGAWLGQAAAQCRDDQLPVVWVHLDRRPKAIDGAVITAHSDVLDRLGLTLVAAPEVDRRAGSPTKMRWWVPAGEFVEAVARAAQQVKPI